MLHYSNVRNIRLFFLNPTLEIIIREQKAVTIYDNLGEKTVFERANLLLTNRRIICSLNLPPLLIVELNLSQIVDIELKQVQSATNQQGSTGLSNRNRHIFTRLFINASVDVGNIASRKEMIQFEFEYGGHNEFHQQLKEQMALKQLISADGLTRPSSSSNLSGQNFGITGIQRNIQSKKLN